ncbi:hypothetical protein [Chitiniphilus eburneus]|uniref:Uncharacterized protein n=1 Tax=Chitiniphilus eburneus TaxID=2571148 RepID=A0A4U0PY47_9NEIS|nr:hypothetical protein [Chitiniphilus eburneus]TJZ73180.1 hypothetical protein FAZ21_11215 [Chitiniphilus eburneus]
MAKQLDDSSTLDLPGVACPQGRRRTRKALRRVEIQWAYRQAQDTPSMTPRAPRRQDDGRRPLIESVSEYAAYLCRIFGK